MAWTPEEVAESWPYFATILAFAVCATAGIGKELIVNPPAANKAGDASKPLEVDKNDRRDMLRADFVVRLAP